MQLVEHLLDFSGIGKDRVQLRWVSAAEGQLFADYVRELTEVIRNLGPFDPEEHRLSLAAACGAVNAPKLRWLVGMDRYLIEKENVYHEKVDPEFYRNMLRATCEEEYQKALILEILKQGPKTVRDMAAGTGLPVYTVSLRLNDLERTGLVEFRELHGSSPVFGSLAA